MHIRHAKLFVSAETNPSSVYPTLCFRESTEGPVTGPPDTTPSLRPRAVAGPARPNAGALPPRLAHLITTVRVCSPTPRPCLPQRNITPLEIILKAAIQSACGVCWALYLLSQSRCTLGSGAPPCSAEPRPPCLPDSTPTLCRHNRPHGPETSTFRRELADWASAASSCPAWKTVCLLTLHIAEPGGVG